MALTIRTAAFALLAALAGLPSASHAQHERDFMNIDDDGHIIFRYPGSVSPVPTPEQMEEITNAFFSVMVHDILRADLLFEADARDDAWDLSLERSLEQQLASTGLDATEVLAECHTTSCRLWVMQSGAWTVEEHQDAMDRLQDVLQGYLQSSPGQFNPVFLLTAYYQEDKTPYLKAFLYRTNAGA